MAFIYAEADIWLERIRETHKKVYRYNKADWEDIKTDIIEIYKEIINTYDSSDINTLWEFFKTNLYLLC